MNQKNNVKFLFCVGLLLAGSTALLCLLDGCSSIPHNKILDIYTAGKEAVPRVWLLDTLHIEQSKEDRSLTEMLPGVLNMVGHKYGIRVEEKRDSFDFVNVSVWLKEQRYTRELETCYSITVLFTLTHSQTGEVVMRAMYSEESRESLQSFQHLYKILDKVFAALSKANP